MFMKMEIIEDNNPKRGLWHIDPRSAENNMADADSAIN